MTKVCYPLGNPCQGYISKSRRMAARKAARELGAGLQGIPIRHAEHEGLEVHSPPGMLHFALSCKDVHVFVPGGACSSLQ